jgi:hypothetical protein
VNQEAEKQVDEFAQSFRSDDSTQERHQGDQGRDVHSVDREKRRGAGHSLSE